ncbi:MAG TPA: HDIG domain-containing protein [Blastocatellia bacterium]|nr:HDIG domain-containing protein [Blastocatellia bacterium]HMV85932.1 HDIG domain-containing protein [Blastocatellia bacterium]HMX28329.1 HDIG domain-containing protein [Blastocatellia bacterium]HMY72714.1 HDIG domain-containing protein [Blastocatellia bacterium]HMZ19630.1 HDIG domain-containing protein [Blastocatellia bacterium]
MKKKAQRLWSSRLQRFPQSAAQRLAALFHRIPQRVRFGVVITVFALVTAISASHFPLTIVPPYRAGDEVESDVVIPANLLLGSDPRVLSVPPQFRRIPILLHVGETVTPDKVPVIEAIRSFQLEQRNPRRLLGLLALIGLMFFGLYKAATTSQSSRLGPRTAFWVSASALMIQTLLVRLGMFGAAVLGTRPETFGFGGIFEFGFAVPFAACALVLSLLVGSQVALVAGLMSAILVGFIAPNGMAFVAFALGSSITAIYSVQRYRTRNAVIIASAAVGAVNLLMSLAAMLIAEQHWNLQKTLGGLIAGLGGALLTAGAASFAIPIYESAFDILTDMKLMELSNADNPLLRQLAIRTPGTNHHSHMVAVLAEEAAKTIGANALLARTGCLYHDIGKLAAPNMYIENQKGGPNPHDTRPPISSARIIANHVKKGIEMGREANLPSQIIDFIPQHHGTRVLAYFYHKAKSQAEARGESVNIEDFRYPGPKPQTREAVILMLADGAEASVRSLEDQTPENIRAIVKKIVDTVVADGQFDESNVTMRELTAIRESLINTLINVYHERISYPGFNPPSEKTGEAEQKIAEANTHNAGAASAATAK